MKSESFVIGCPSVGVLACCANTLSSVIERFSSTFDETGSNQQLSCNKAALLHVDLCRSAEVEDE